MKTEKDEAYFFVMERYLSKAMPPIPAMATAMPPKMTAGAVRPQGSAGVAAGAEA